MESKYKLDETDDCPNCLKLGVDCFVSNHPFRQLTGSFTSISPLAILYKFLLHLFVTFFSFSFSLLLLSGFRRPLSFSYFVVQGHVEVDRLKSGIRQMVFRDAVESHACHDFRRVTLVMFLPYFTRKLLITIFISAYCLRPRTMLILFNSNCGISRIILSKK